MFDSYDCKTEAGLVIATLNEEMGTWSSLALELLGRLMYYCPMLDNY